MPADKDYYDENELLNKGFKSIGIDVRVSKTAVIKYPSEVSIGNHVTIDDYVVITTKAKIGDYVQIATAVVIYGGSRSLLIMEDYTFIAASSTLVVGTDDYHGDGLVGPIIPMKYRKVIFGITILKKYSGLGTNTVLLPNVTIDEGTLTGAMTLVTKSLGPWGVYIGIPARRLKSRRKDLVERFAEEIEGGK